MRGWLDDLTYAGRRLLRSPGFALAAILILTVGIGVNSTAFSVVNALLLQPPPFQHPERVVMILQDDDRGSPNSTSYPAYLDISRTPDVFASTSAFSVSESFLEQGESLAPIQTEYVTSDYLTVIGLAPARGVWFDAGHDDPNGPPAAVVTYRMWTDVLASDPNVLGSTLRIGGGAVTVVGVGPAAFNGGRALAASDVWLSISAIRATGGRVASLQRRQDHPFIVRARLAPGVSLVQASQVMDRLAGQLAADYPELNQDRGMSVLSVLDTRISPDADAEIVPAAALTMVVVVLVLIIGTLNLANLLLVRSTARAREIAVRLALGAGRGRIIRVVLSEAIILSVVGGAGGLGLAALAARTVRNSRFDAALPLLIDLRLDARVVGFTLLVSVAAGLVFGLVPALRSTRRDVNASLRDDTSRGLSRRRRIGLTGGLVAGQVAVSLLLLTVAGVFVESLVRAQGADPGFDWEDTAYLQVNSSQLELDGEGTMILFDQIESRLEALPSVARVTRSFRLPGTQFGTTTLLLGSGTGGTDRPSEIPWNIVSLDYFDVMGVPVLHGRTFREDDMAGPDVAVVSAAFARTYWGRTDIVGESYRSESEPDAPVEIIGVVDDVSVRGLGEAPTPSLYWLLNFPTASVHLIVEAERADALSDAMRDARETLRDIDPRLLLLSTSTMGDHLGDTLERQRLAGGLLAALGSLALVLAMLGVYGVVSFAVSRRRREVGIRIALGAGGDSVVRLFVRDVAAVVLAGAALGGALAIPAGRFVGVTFTGSTPSPGVTAGVALLLLATSLVATILPALGATRTDPTDALRLE